MAHIAKDMGTPIAHMAWAHGYHMAQRVAMPVILTGILVLEKVDQELDHLKTELEN